MLSSNLYPPLSRWNLTKSTQSINSGANTDVTWNASAAYEYPTDLWSSGASVTIKHKGIYIISTAIAFDYNATGYRQIQIQPTRSVGAAPFATKIVRTISGPASARTRLQVTWTGYLDEGDTVKVVAVHSAGVALNLDSSYSAFMGARLGRW